jgi:hypothetical protein
MGRKTSQQGTVLFLVFLYQIFGFGLFPIPIRRQLGIRLKHTPQLTGRNTLTEGF